MTLSIFPVLVLSSMLTAHVPVSESPSPLASGLSPVASSERGQSSASLQHTPATATANQAAHIVLDLPDTPVTDRQSATVELVVRPDEFSSNELFIVMVYAREPTDVQPDGSKQDEFLGGFTWHMPPQNDEPTTFYVNAPERFRLTDSDHAPIEIDVRLTPVDSNVPLRHSRLTILQAAIVP